jgi:hypothetical protein
VGRAEKDINPINSIASRCAVLLYKDYVRGTWSWGFLCLVDG